MNIYVFVWRYSLRSDMYAFMFLSQDIHVRVIVRKNEYELYITS